MNKKGAAARRREQERLRRERERVFKDRLRKAFQASVLTKGQVATLVKVDPARISDWLRAPEEKGATMPSAENLRGLTKALGVSGHWLLTGEGDMKVPPGADAEIVKKIRALVNPQPATTPDVLDGAQAGMDPVSETDGRTGGGGT